MSSQIVKNITQKNEVVAMEAAKELLDTADVEAFEELCEKSDFLFDFVKDNVCKRLFNVANVNNYKNVMKLFDIYDDNYSDVFVRILSKFSDDDLKKRILCMMELGTESQKAYCAKYFEKHPDENAILLLNKEAFSDDECLSVNCIKALAAVNNRNGIYTAYEKLKSKDAFEILKAIRFLMNYPDLSRLDDVVSVAVNSSMSENNAQEIANAIDLFEFIKEKQFEQRLLLLNAIINGLGEILPLSNILYYRMFEIAGFLINLSYEEESSQIAQILWNMRLKFKLLFENEEYTYDEDVETKNELKKIFALLNNQGEDFWSEQKLLISGEFQQDEKRIIAALNTIKEMEDYGDADVILALLNSPNELVVCQAAETLKVLGRLDGVDLRNIVPNIKNDNIRAIIENMCV